MQDYVSAQTYAMRSADNSRFGFAWSPRNLGGLPTADFNAQTDALLVRLAAAIADSAESPEAACGATWCNRDLAGAALTTTWRTFATWKPSVLAFTTPVQTLSPGMASAPLTVELRSSSGTVYTAGVPVPVELSSSSPTGELSVGPDGPWAPTLTTAIASGATATTFYVRDSQSGSATVTAAAAGKTAAAQTVTVAAAAAPPDPVPPPPSSGGGGGGAAPDLLVEASAAPAAPTIGGTITYLVNVRNLAGAASRAYAHVQLPGQVIFAAAQTNRGPGCTGTTTLTCDLDFLSGEIVATVQIQATVRAIGTLTMTATSEAVPTDGQPANDTATVVTVVGSAEQAAGPAPDAPPALRVVGKTPLVVRRAATAEVSVRFWVSEGARLQARITPLASSRAITLLAGTTIAGSRATAIRTAATATVSRRGTYLARLRLQSARLILGRSYLLRITAVDSIGQRRALTIRVRA